MWTNEITIPTTRPTIDQLRCGSPGAHLVGQCNNNDIMETWVNLYEQMSEQWKLCYGLFHPLTLTDDYHGIEEGGRWWWFTGPLPVTLLITMMRTQCVCVCVWRRDFFSLNILWQRIMFPTKEDLMSLLCFTQMVTRNISANHLIPGKVPRWSITSNGVPWLWLRMTPSLCFLLCELCHPACHPGFAQFQHHVKWIWKNVQRKLLLKQSCIVIPRNTDSLVGSKNVVSTYLMNRVSGFSTRDQQGRNKCQSFPTSTKHIHTHTRIRRPSYNGRRRVYRLKRPVVIERVGVVNTVVENASQCRGSLGSFTVLGGIVCMKVKALCSEVDGGRRRIEPRNVKGM